MSIYISGYPSVLQVCLLAVQPGLLARLAMHLAMHPAIWLSCISIHLHIWQSGNLAVHSSASARICLPFCPAILFCQPVLQDVHLSPAHLVVCLPERISAVVRNVCTAARASGCHSACLHECLFCWLHICLSGCSSVCLSVCSIVRLFIWLHLAAGLVAYQ